ncbi:hypothetical protein TNCV_1840341 [Trichonephila clavipes]|nr:hypothetical protein TNCV_1840341 [Trichonephila clavipes]
MPDREAASIAAGGGPTRAVQDLWAHLPQDNIRCLINSMPDLAQQPMRDRAYCAHPSIFDHWTLRDMSICPDQMVSMKRDPSV